MSGFWRRAAVQTATEAALRVRDAAVEAPELPWNPVPAHVAEAAIVPRAEVPRTVEAEEQPWRAVPMPEVARLEMRHMLARKCDGLTRLGIAAQAWRAEMQ